MKETLDTRLCQIQMPQIGDFFVDCKHSQSFVNKQFLYVECITLYRSYVVLEKEFVSKKRNSLTDTSFKSCDFT